LLPDFIAFFGVMNSMSFSGRGNMYCGLRSRFALGAVALVLAGGCGGGPEGGNVKLAPGGGTVTFKGAPLAGATVTFIPENGPLATAQTDLSGKFKLSTGGQAGVAVGKSTVTVTAIEGGAAPSAAQAGRITPGTIPSDPEEVKKRMEAQGRQMLEGASKAAGAGPKSVIPEIYAKQSSSPLSFTVDSDGSKNDFKIELKE
jgi:hypothetical protein